MPPTARDHTRTRRPSRISETWNVAVPQGNDRSPSASTTTSSSANASRVSYDVPVPEQAQRYTGCWVRFDPEDQQVFGSDPPIDLISVGCDSARPNGLPTHVVAPETGTYRLVYSTWDLLLRQDYRFTVEVEG